MPSSGSPEPAALGRAEQRFPRRAEQLAASLQLARLAIWLGVAASAGAALAWGFSGELPAWAGLGRDLFAGLAGGLVLVTGCLWWRWQADAHRLAGVPAPMARLLWWVVPLANLVVPFTELRQVSRSAGVRRDELPLARWWATFLATGLSYLYVPTGAGVQVAVTTTSEGIGTVTELLMRTGLAALGVVAARDATTVVRALTRALLPSPGFDPGDGSVARQTRRRIVVGVGLAALVGGGFAALLLGMTSDVRSTADAYLDAVRAQDGAAAHALMHPLLTDDLSAEVMDETLAGAEVLPATRIAGVEVVSDEANITVRVEDPDRGRYLVQLFLIRDRNGWLIAGIHWDEHIATLRTFDTVARSYGIPAELVTPTG